MDKKECFQSRVQSSSPGRITFSLNKTPVKKFLNMNQNVVVENSLSVSEIWMPKSADQFLLLIQDSDGSAETDDLRHQSNGNEARK